MTSTDEIRILLVNDDPGSLFALQTVLTDLGTPVETATSGEEALMLLLKQDFAAMLTDVVQGQRALHLPYPVRR